MVGAEGEEERGEFIGNLTRVVSFVTQQADIFSLYNPHSLTFISFSSLKFKHNRVSPQPICLKLHFKNRQLDLNFAKTTKILRGIACCMGRVSVLDVRCCIFWCRCMGRVSVLDVGCCIFWCRSFVFPATDLLRI
ncbi:uncharacterized protein [Spinacia oleracea]|uniref:Uncharacterized protein n=1 Tax=Spinacia oleracea TaxID=3562 RepID=A0ABM3RIH7_SPIOL|nr:uncharacterized protein LOC110788485 [Spinacia oleracea]